MSATKKVLAVASGGGHWSQLLRVRPAFDHCEVVFVTVNDGYADDVPGARFRVVRDATRWNKLRLVQQALQVLRIVLAERPDVVISTGAAPGFFAIAFGKCIGARTIWIDSIANAERLSLSGTAVGWFADLWLTQWPHLETERGPRFAGAVL